jgi:lysophospholipase L1-like esterase
MPRGAVPGRFPEKIVKLNQLIDALAKDEVQITLCDTWSIFANEQGVARPEEFPDLLHPNAAGYAKWATALNPIFAKLKLGQN